MDKMDKNQKWVNLTHISEKHLGTSKMTTKEELLNIPKEKLQAFVDEINALRFPDKKE